jgi:hypothetical protein
MNYFPLKQKCIGTTNSETEFLSSYEDVTEIPLLPHPGAFGKQRKHHQHEGVDLYCVEFSEVIAIEDGLIKDIFPFTGTMVGTPWWNDTWGILIEGELGVFNYGELVPASHLKTGQRIKAGEVLGTIRQVLVKDKNRPMSMLHLEMYVHGTDKAITSWDNNEHKPEQLCNPTELLIQLANLKDN